MSRNTYRPAMRIAIVTAAILALPFAGMQFSDEVNWTFFDFALAGGLLVVSGLLIELAMQNPRNLIFRAVAVTIGIAAVVLGELDDAPGLMLFGFLLIGTAALQAVKYRVRAG